MKVQPESVLEVRKESFGLMTLDLTMLDGVATLKSRIGFNREY
jgi:hypothetical protein